MSILHLQRIAPLSSLMSRQISTGTMMYPPLQKGGIASGPGTGGPPTTLVPKGKVFKKDPMKVLCERGRTYKWCSCGVSNKQPFCDGRPMCRPVDFKPREDKEFMFCLCKQTNKQPLCDGSHKKLG